MIEQLNNHDVNQIGTIISCLIGSAFFSASETRRQDVEKDGACNRNSRISQNRL